MASDLLLTQPDPAPGAGDGVVWHGEMLGYDDSCEEEE